MLVLGLTGPLLILFSLGIRYGLGFDAPWYLLELIGLGYIPAGTIVVALAGIACAAQLAAITAGRYTPYPARGARGPLRQLVRVVVHRGRARRRVTDERRRAFGG